MQRKNSENIFTAHSLVHWYSWYQKLILDREASNPDLKNLHMVVCKDIYDTLCGGLKLSYR